MRRERATRRALSPPQNPTPLVNILFPQPEPGPYWIPVGKIVNDFGQAFTTEQHHHVRYLESGFDDFARFYRLHQPETILQAHFIDETLPGPAQANLLDVPWQHDPRAKTATREPDPSFFGPVSNLELATEAARLDEVLHSIKKYGYLTGSALRSLRLGGQLMGRIFLKDNGDFRLVTANGRHRAAALTHLGWDLIPVQIQPDSRPVRLSDLERWPGVVDGRFTQETAHAMFESFFRPRHRQLLPGW